VSRSCRSYCESAALSSRHTTGCSVNRAAALAERILTPLSEENREGHSWPLHRQPVKTGNARILFPHRETILAWEYFVAHGGIPF
jgi:hypothetical protein